MFNLRDFRSSPTWLSHLVFPPVMCDNPPPISASSLSLGDGMVPVAECFTNIYSLCVDQMCVSLLTTVLSCYFQVSPLILWHSFWVSSWAWNKIQVQGYYFYVSIWLSLCHLLEGFFFFRWVAFVPWTKTYRLHLCLFWTSCPTSWLCTLERHSHDHHSFIPALVFLFWFFLQC